MPTSMDKSSIVTIATCALTGTFVITFIARQIMKAVVFRKVAIDDFLILFATICAVGLSVMTLILASNGLGVLEPLTVQRANLFMKSYYVSEILYVLSICFAKLSILVLFYNIVALRTHRFFVLGFGIFVFTWSLASTLTIAFQCGLPRPWEMLILHCFNKRIFWVVYCAIDMSTEIAIITLSIDLVAHLKVRLMRKFTVVACFAPRILVIMSSLVRAVFLYQATLHTTPSHDFWISTVCTQVHVFSSICTACIPYMLPFFKSLQGNIWRSGSTKNRNTAAKSTNFSDSSPKLLQKREAKLRYHFLVSPTQGVDRVSKFAPHIPSPAPLSPLMPAPNATYLLPESSADTSDWATTTSDRASTQGMSISGTLYDSDSEQTFDICVRQLTNSSSASLFDPSTQPLLNNVMPPSRYKEPIRPFPTYCPSSPSASSVYSSRSSVSSSPTRTSQSPLQRRQDLGNASAPPILSQTETTQGLSPRLVAQSADDDTARLIIRQTLPSAATPYTLDDFTYPTRSSSTKYLPKFSTTPRLESPPPTTIPPPPVQS